MEVLITTLKRGITFVAIDEDGFLRSITKLMRVTLVAITLYFISIGHLSFTLSSLMVLAVTFYIPWRERHYGARFPAGSDLFLNTILLMHASGYAFKLYSRILHWDTFEHFLSGIMVGIIGFSMVLGFQLRHNITTHYRNAFFVAVMLAVLVGSTWEIIEYGLDQIQILDFLEATNHKRLQWDLEDTMNDMTLNQLGGMFAGIFGYFIYRHKSDGEKRDKLGYFVKMFE